MYVISDTHFGHYNIIKYCNRPFKTVEEMDSYIIEKWNSIIKKNDKVFFLGDFSNYNKQKNIEICNQLNGYKAIILGNHDHNKTYKYWNDIGFKEIYKYPIVLNEFMVLSHCPILNVVNDNTINIHGHIHNKTLGTAYQKHINHFINVSVENINYVPVNLDKIQLDNL